MRGEYSVTRSTSRGLRITRCTRTSNEEAPRNTYIICYRKPHSVSLRTGYTEGCMHDVYTSPEDIYDCHVLPYTKEVAKFLERARTKRCKRLFIYMKPHSHLPSPRREQASFRGASMQK